MNGHAEEDVSASCEHVFDQFVNAVTCKSILTSFHQLLDLTGLRHVDHTHFYERLKQKLIGSWKAQSLWTKLDKRASHRDYRKGQACSNLRVLIIGSGPCGLRTAIECAFLGAKTVIVEKRDRFSRNNVLHLWPYLITDLRNLGAKKFFGKFCAGAIDHISIRQLQCILLKAALLLGVEVHVNVSFDGLIEPPEDQSSGIGWRCKVTPADHVLSEYQFDVLIGADGKRNTLPGFKRKEFRGKLAIAVTANFINRNSQAEARVEEISGVAFIFNQKFFLDLKESTRIDLENIVYYKDDTHYFVMTAKKASLLDKGVLKEDYTDTVALLDRSNVNQDALMAYAREAADFSTNYQLPSLDYAFNHYGQADVAMFDFTSMFAAENASRFILKNGHHLLTSLVGDSLLEPFWPTGSGCARGFLGAFDAAWMIRSWALGKSPLQVLAERESIYTVLSQTTPNYLHKNHNMYSLDPNTRYPNLNLRAVKPSQVRNSYEGGVFDDKDLEEEDLAQIVPTKKARNIEQSIDSYSLLRWCQRVLNTGKYRDVHVVDFTSSWRSGLALCALIHSFRPELINNTLLMECDVAANNQLAFIVAEKELGIPPVMTGEDMGKYEVPDKLTMVSYLSQFYDLFKHEPLPSTIPLPVKSKRKSLPRDSSNNKQPKSPHSPSKRISFLQKISSKLPKSKKRKEQEENEGSPFGSKKLKERQEKGDVELTRYNKLPMEEIVNRFQLDRKTDIKVNKTEERSGAVSVTAMADLLVAKFKSNEAQPPLEPVRRLKGQPSLLAATAASEFCSFCHKRVYIMERMSAEGEFFHRGCLKCDHCGVGLRLTNYSCDRDTKPVKFYCYRHAIPEMRTRPQRKRGLEEEEVEESVPSVIITPAPDVDTGQASKQKSPKKIAIAQLTPVALPPPVAEQAKNTPERIEFEISFDGQEEESEEEQFEHNLRASLSCDRLLNDEDSDLSDSDIESGEEDEVWENTSESFKSPLLSMTLEEACELRGSWRRQHSFENVVDATQPEYTRLKTAAGDDDEEEEEDSSTEVEEGSEFETDSSSSEEESDEDKTEPAKNRSNDASLRSPISPVSRISASKANFFSEPPTVVSLDPWSMFGIGNKEASKEMALSEKVASGISPKVQRKRSSISSRKKSSSSESKSASHRRRSGESKKDASSKDTDISESLELDSRSPDVFQDQNEHVSGAGSLDELRDDFLPDATEEKREKTRSQSLGSGSDVNSSEKMQSHSVQSTGSGEGSEKSRPHSILKKMSVDSLDINDTDDGREEDRGSEGDDECVEDEEEEELMEKTAVSRAMEQLLHDIDHKSFSKESSSENLYKDSSDNEAYVEGRLSPSASKTRKFRMKRHTRRSREQRMSRSTTSDSEAGRTDPATTTDNYQAHSSVSCSPSAELVPEGKVVLQPTEEDAGNSPHRTRDLKESTVLKGETESGDDTLQQALANAAAISDLSDNSDIDDLVLKNIDDRFVTDRCKKKKAKEGAVKDETSSKKDVQINSSFSISTPSDTESSVSSIEVDEFAGQILELEPGDDDIKPDQDILKDYTTTLSLALGESYSSDEAEEKVAQDNDNDLGDKSKALPVANLDSKELSSDIGNSKDNSVNAPNTAISNDSKKKQESNENNYSAPLVAIRRPLPVPHSQAHIFQPHASPLTSAADIRNTKESSKSSTLLITSKGDNRDSSGSEIFFSPVESFTAIVPLVNNSSTPKPNLEASLSQNSAATTVTSQQPDSSKSLSLTESSSTPSTISSKPVTSTFQRKLPHLPKLNILDKPSLQAPGGDGVIDPPIMCSSPKLRNKATPKSSTPDLRTPNRLFPAPGSSRNSGKTVGTAGTASKSLSTPSQKDVKSVSPHVFKPPPKTKIPLDKSRLRLGSSSDHAGSYHDLEAKKKISAEGIMIGHTIDDDIPFADESEAEEHFYTPCDPDKKEPPKFPTAERSSAHRQILPGSQVPVAKSDPAILSAQQIREIRKADMEKAKFQARERARLKSDEELGLTGSPTMTPSRKHPGFKGAEYQHARRTSYDTPSTSDILTDSDDHKVSSTQTGTSSATEGDHLSEQVVSSSKKKVKTPKKRKEKKGVKEKDMESKEKRKSLLALILPGKTLEKGMKNSSGVLSSESTPKGSGSTMQITDKTPKGKKTKPSKAKNASIEDFEKTPSSDTKKELAICSVFHSEASNRQARSQLGVGGAAKRTIALAPKASADELSDSDESHISLSTMHRRRDEDLDERLARRLRKMQLKQQKQAEQKRLRMAQEIQRQLEEVEVRQKELEERGIAVEKALRGDGPEEDNVDENQLMSEWFTLVHEKNALLRYESELNVRAKELELEDRQARLEIDFRERSRQPETSKREQDIAAEGILLDELLEVVEQRNNLVAMLEEDRVREQKEDSDLKQLMAEKGFVLSPLSFDTRRERQKIEAPLASLVL